MTDIDNLLKQSVEIASLLRLLRDRDSLGPAPCSAKSMPTSVP